MAVLSTRPAVTGAVDVAGLRAGDAGAPPPIERLLGNRWWTVVMFAGGCLAGLQPLGDNSFLTHLATGRRILAVGAPTSDPYSYVAAGRPWSVQSWLASWWYATLERLGGLGLVRVFVALAIGVLVALVWRLSAPAVALGGRLALCGLSMVAGLHWWSERPQTIAFVLAALTLVCLIERRPVWWLGPIAGLWVNVHGSFPVMAALVATWWLVASVEDRSLRSREPIAGALAALGLLAGAAVSPYGFDLLTFPFRMIGRSEVLQYIVEWRSPSLQEPSTWFAAILALVCAGALARKRRWVRLTVLMVFVLAAAWSARNVPFAALLAVALAGPSLAGLGSLLPGEPVTGRPRALAMGLVLAAVSVVVAVTPDVDRSAYPVESLAWASEHGLLSAEGARLVSHDYVGNYLELFGPMPSGGVFVDDRAEIFEADEIRDYVRLLEGAPEWPEILDRYDATVVVWDVESPLAGELSRDGAPWRVVHRDDRAVVAVRS